MIELEKTYLAKELPADLKEFKSKELIDLYIPASSDHPVLRLRKNGEKYEMTKKEPIKDGDASEQLEQTIMLTEVEFNALSKLDGKKVHKIRYNYKYNNLIAEFDVFQGALSGLVVVDFEFKTSEEKNSFKMPEFCLADITQEKFLAGGMVCGKNYEDIKVRLDQFKYKKISI